MPKVWSNQKIRVIGKSESRGFTLVELLIVIVIIAILTAIGLVVFREVNTRARDGSRIADLNSLKNAIQITTHDAESMPLALCTGLTSPCEGVSYPEDANTKKTDGAGWVKVNFDEKNEANFPFLPVDPINNATYYFSYKSEGDYWQIEANLESSEYKKLMEQDGGNNPDRYEVGTNIKSL
jgi:prepilin-type N-terminal cleavage/methylation domain-containing protein